jgi:hypothetical protein
MPDDAALGTVAVLVLLGWAVLLALVLLLILGDR